MSGADLRPEEILAAAKPEELADHERYLEMAGKNPVAAARWARERLHVYSISEARRAIATATAEAEKRREQEQATTLASAPPPASTVDALRAQYNAIKAKNPIAAARFAATHRLHD